MFTRATVLLTLFLLPPGATAQPAASYPGYSVSFPGGVTGFPDVVYASYVGYRALSLDLYEPPPQARPSPLILFLHGGSLKTGDARLALGIPDFPARLAAMAAHGYVVASVNYRLRDEAKLPAQVQDAKAAIAFLRANAAKYHIDPARAVVWGNSSGGQLAALVAMTCGRKAFAPPSSGANDCVQGVVSWYGDLNFSAEMNDPDAIAALGCAPCKAADFAAADPMTFASSASPPMLMIQGSADAEAVAQSQAMAKRLTDLKVPVETLYIPDVGHGFIGKTPGITRAANDHALARTLKFIDALFGR